MSDEPTVAQIAETLKTTYWNSAAGESWGNMSRRVLDDIIRPLTQRAERAEREWEEINKLAGARVADLQTRLGVAYADLAAAQQARAEAEAQRDRIVDSVKHAGIVFVEDSDGNEIATNPTAARIATLEAERDELDSERAMLADTLNQCLRESGGLDRFQADRPTREGIEQMHFLLNRTKIERDSLRADLAARDRLVGELRGVLKQIADATYSTHTHTGLTLIARSALALTPASLIAEGAAERAVVDAAITYRDVMPPHTEYPEAAWLRSRRLFIESVDALAALRADRKAEG